ncbi:hypothetical protein [Bradyrhizobium japonicum]|uniref:hypothetical protein n=1 Tax=Bradyrhizobium japonicum TaxID=375 RepID=UPI001BA68660|nr:hypothetical protein [Bradyrhizobium japonicum]
MAMWLERMLPRNTQPMHLWYGVEFVGPPEGYEREAIAAAKYGDFKPLAILRQLGIPLGDEANALINTKLMGENFPAKRRGRPSRPLFDDIAAEEVSSIEKLLREHFPGRSVNRAYAIDLAALRNCMDRERLANHPAFKRHR